MTGAFRPTPEQQAIMDFPLRPLRIAAGAGTGKTTTMALRLVELISREGLAPEQALGVTFTNKAAEELAHRLRHHLPEFSAEGREVEVTTYHGFAHQVLREFGAVVGVERDAKIITPGYARQLLRDALGAGQYEHLDLTAPSARVNEVALLADRLTDHLHPASALRAAAAARADDEVWARRAEIAATIERYEELKRKTDTLDYGDLISQCFRLLDEHPGIAARVRERYRVVLLDEYQDTNPAQRELLLRIFGDGFPVTAVGDPDQTIYEWRGASLENFAAFAAHFPGPNGEPAPTLSLSVNRRCDRHIIDIANEVKGRIEGETGIDRLLPHEDAGDGHVERSWFADAGAEAAWIAEEVRRLHDDEEVPWKSMAVLVRKNALIESVRHALEASGVPVEVAAIGGLLAIPEVADLHAWLRLIGRPADGGALVRVLLGAFFRLGLGNLAPTAAWVRRHRGSDAVDEGAPGWAMLEAVDRLDEIEGIDPEIRLRLERFRGLYRGLLADAQGVNLAELCRRILDRTGAWAEVEALDDAARLSARLNLYRFLDLAETWSPLEGRPSLDAFLDYLELLQEDDLSAELDTARLSGEDAVSLITIHRAKGLEWPVVFIPAVCKGTLPSTGQKTEDPLRFPEVLPFDLRLDAATMPRLGDDASENKALLAARHLAQEWRTAYVGVTRAKHRLYLTGAFRYSPVKPKEPSELFELAGTVPGVVTAHLEPLPLPWPEPSPDPPTAAPDPHFESGWLGALRATIADPVWPRTHAPDPDGFAARRSEIARVLDGLPQPPAAADPGTFPAVTVTDLVTFASCPQRFHWTTVDRLPRRPSRARSRGIEIHRRIELFNHGTVPAEDVTDDLYDLPPEAVPTHGAAKRPDPFQVFLDSRFAAAIPLLTEAPFNLRLGPARVRGRIDAVYEPEPGSWEIVDFKSGVRSDDPARRVQLQAYALAACDAGIGPVPPDALTVTFAYLGGVRLETVSESTDDDWLGEARIRLESLVAGIAAGDDHPNPSTACRSCDFVRFCAAGQAFLATDKPG